MRKWFTHPDGCTYLYQAIFLHIFNPRVFFSGLRCATEPFRAAITYTLRFLRSILARLPGARHRLCTGSQAVFMGNRDRKKLVIIDEAWDLLKAGEVSTFIEHAYRKFRKYDGSVVIATQSLNDLYSSPVGVAIAENSAHKFLLGQTAEAVESLRASKRLDLPESGYSALKTVHTLAGVYSEIFIQSETGCGIGRLVVSDFQKLLYST